MAWTNPPVKNNLNVIDQGDWNVHRDDLFHLGGADGNTKTGGYVIGGSVVISTGGLTVTSGTGGFHVGASAVSGTPTLTGISVTAPGQINLSSVLPGLAGGEKYLVIDVNGTVKKSALGPAS